MYEQLLEKNRSFIRVVKSYRSYSDELKSLVESLNTKKITTISGLRHTGKTKLVFTLLEKTQSFETSFYYNSDLDTLGSIKTHEDFIILFDLYVRIYGIPKIIVLQNTNNIDGIKDLISKLYNTKKYKIIVVGNNIKIQ
jgi:predicted AAA+ superfamily ATPase